MTRRDFLSASAGLAVTPVLGGAAGAATLPREADIVVIGAGAAGIAAARRIMAANRKVIVVEAAGQIGGRCQTDISTFDVPFDRGARWMHNPENPMIKLARAAGLEISTVSLGQKIRIGRRYARAGETEELLTALVRANRAIDEASRRLDVSCASVLAEGFGRLGRNGGVRARRQLLRQGPEGCLRRRQGPRAGPQYGDRCRQGLGTLIAKLGEQVPLSLSTPANRISWDRRDVTVETPSGKIAARAAIITVSRQRAGGGQYQIQPRYSQTNARCRRKLSLGSYDRIALQMPGNPLGLARDEVIIEQSNSTRTALLYANMGSSSLCSIDVAGSFGRDLSAQGEKAMVAFAVEWLTKLFGSEAASAVKKSSATRWNSAPYAPRRDVLGRAGRAASRKVLAEPIGCMYLAGEATHERSGHDRRRMGKRRTRRRSGVAADRRATGYRACRRAGTQDTAAHAAGDPDQLMSRPRR
jgi:monoamine oxidase